MKSLPLLLALAIMAKCSKNSSLHGTWISDEYEHYIVKFTSDKLYEIHDKDTSVYNYLRGSKSCDESYSKEPNLDFLSLEDGRCFEITGLTDTSLAYRHTVSGRLQVFHKLSASKKRNR